MPTNQQMTDYNLTLSLLPRLPLNTPVPHACTPICQGENPLRSLVLSSHCFGVVHWEARWEAHCGKVSDRWNTSHTTPQCPKRGTPIRFPYHRRQGFPKEGPYSQKRCSGPRWTPQAPTRALLLPSWGTERTAGGKVR